MYSNIITHYHNNTQRKFNFRPIQWNTDFKKSNYLRVKSKATSQAATRYTAILAFFQCSGISMSHVSGKFQVLFKIALAVSKYFIPMITMISATRFRWCAIFHLTRICGAMDNALDYGSRDSRFDSWQIRIFISIYLSVNYTLIHLSFELWKCFWNDN